MGSCEHYVNFIIVTWGSLLGAKKMVIATFSFNFLPQKMVKLVGGVPLDQCSTLWQQMGCRESLVINMAFLQF